MSVEEVVALIEMGAKLVSVASNASDQAPAFFQETVSDRMVFGVACLVVGTVFYSVSSLVMEVTGRRYAWLSFGGSLFYLGCYYPNTSGLAGDLLREAERLRSLVRFPSLRCNILWCHHGPHCKSPASIPFEISLVVANRNPSLGRLGTATDMGHIV